MIGIKPGQMIHTKEGYDVEVLEYKNSTRILVRHLDNGYEQEVNAVSVRQGAIKNPYHPTVYGIGYLGVGEYRSRVNGNRPKVYSLWVAMLKRAYSPKSLAARPTYQGCYVCKEWHNFQNFAEWYYQQPNSGKEGFTLDKDLMVWGNREYGPSTCSLVPQEVNKLLTDHGNARGALPIGVIVNPKGLYIAQLSVHGSRVKFGPYSTVEEAYAVYKMEKEKHVKKVAIKYKDQLHRKVFDNLMEWEVTNDLQDTQ